MLYGCQMQFGLTDHLTAAAFNLEFMAPNQAHYLLVAYLWNKWLKLIFLAGELLGGFFLNVFLFRTAVGQSVRNLHMLKNTVSFENVI